MQQPNAFPMLPNMAAMGGMMPPGFNPLLAAMNNMKPEELSAMAASFGMKNIPMIPQMPNPMAAMNATTSQAHSAHNNNHHNSSSINANQSEGVLNNSRAASTSRPQSTSGTPVSKRAKIDLEETDGELEIDVQNDDATSSSARPSSTSHANGTSHKNAKSGRESAQSISSSRDSSATPKSNKQSVNIQNAMAAALQGIYVDLKILLHIILGGDLNAFLGMTAFGGAAPFMDSSRRLVCPVTGTQSNGKAPYAYRIVDGGTPHPVQFPTDALTGPDIPKYVLIDFSLYL